MSKIKVLIVEDELGYALELEMLIQELGYELMAIVKDGKSVFEILEKDTPDLVLMDIQLDGNMNGIEVAKKIQNKKIGIIFITSLNDNETFNKARAAKNFGYLVKPFNMLTLEAAIETALRYTHNETDIELDLNNSKQEPWTEDLILRDYIFIKKRSRLEKVAIKDIEYIEADGNYSVIQSEKNKYILKLSLVKVSKSLPEKDFIRINKRHIVNTSKITSIDVSTYKIFLKNGTFTIGRKYKIELLNKLKMLT